MILFRKYYYGDYDAIKGGAASGSPEGGEKQAQALIRKKINLQKKEQLKNHQMIQKLNGGFGKFLFAVNKD
jgi:protoporphyrinogen oxidase